MVDHTRSGRHRNATRYNPVAELSTIVKSAGETSVKASAVLAASGGLVAAFALPAQAANRLNPIQGFPGSDSIEAQTAAEQFAQARGLVGPDAYRTAFESMQKLPADPSGTAWTEPTKVPYDSDDLRYRDPNGNSTGGSGIVSGRVVAVAANAAGDTLYAGSDATSVAGRPGLLVALDPVTGAADPTFDATTEREMLAKRIADAPAMWISIVPCKSVRTVGMRRSRNAASTDGCG